MVPNTAHPNFGGRRDRNLVTGTSVSARTLACMGILAVGCALVACTVQTGGGGSSNVANLPDESPDRASAAAEAACIPACTEVGEDVDVMYDMVEDYERDGMSQTEAAGAVLDLIDTNHPDAGDGASRAELCQACVETVAEEVYSGTAPPADDDDQPDTPTEEESDLDLTFPESGDALVIAEDDSGTTSVTVYGSFVEETEQATLTAIDIETEDGAATALLDEQGRPTDIDMGTRTVTAQYHPDGTAFLELTENDQLLLSEDNVSLDTSGGLPDGAGGVFRAYGHVGGDHSEYLACSTLAHKDDLRVSLYAGSCMDKELVNLAKLPLEQFGHSPDDSIAKQSCVYDCLGQDRAFLRQLRHYCVLEGFLERMEATGQRACEEARDRGWRCDEVLKQAFLTASSYRVMLSWANEGAAAECWDDPACWCESDEASEVGSDCPAGWSCIDGHCLPKCSTDFDCHAGAKCDTATGRCAPQHDAKRLAGCWVLTLYPEGGGAASTIIQIDEQGRLERTWRIEAGPPRRTVETRRFTVPEPPVWQSIRRSMSQSVTVTADGQVEIKQIVEDNGCSLDANGVCRADTSNWTRDEVTIRARIAGDPPARLEAGTFSGLNTTRFPDNPEWNESRSENGTVVGTAELASPDPADPNVFTQEERGSPCAR